MFSGFQFDHAMAGHKGNPTVILIGTSFHFSDQLMRLLRFGLEGVRFERIAALDELSDWNGIADVVVVHEAMDDLEDCIDRVRRDLPGALIAIGCSNPAIVQQIPQPDPSRPVSALQMNVQVDVWFSVLRLLLSGHPYVPAGLSPAAPVRHEAVPSGAPDMAEADLPAVGPARLTPREMEILPLIAQGKQNKVIASKLGLSVHTVKLHSHNIFSKLGVTNRTGAASWYLSQRMDHSHVKASRPDQGR